MISRANTPHFYAVLILSAYLARYTANSHTLLPVLSTNVKQTTTKKKQQKKLIKCIYLYLFCFKKNETLIFAINNESNEIGKLMNKFHRHRKKKKEKVS